MARPRVAPDEIREKVSISPDRRILAWIDANTGMGKRFASRTHAFEWCAAQIMEGERGTDSARSPTAEARRAAGDQRKGRGS